MTTPAADSVTTLPEALAIIARERAEIARLKEELAQLKRMIFGQKRERFVPAEPVAEEQMTLEGLFEHAGATIPGFAETRERITYERRKPRKGHGRKPIPDDLHREKHVLDVPESEKQCSCCGAAKTHIGDDITEELEYRPAVFFVNQYIRPKYACPACKGAGVATAALPARPIDKGIAGPGLLSYIITSKYVDHLPLYRLQQMFMRYAIDINRSTMAGWIAQLCVPLQALYEAMRQELRRSFLVQADETTLRVLDETVKDKCLLGYLWPFVGDGRLAVFEFADSRSRDGPCEFLSGFRERYLLSDGYAGYNEVIQANGLKHLMCWAHARRKFFEAKELAPEFVGTVLSLIGRLYDVERDAKEMPPEQRYALRSARSKTILADLKNLLEHPGMVLLPKSKTAEAVAYTLSHWIQLNRFLEDGRLPIDNNLVENIIRPVALGRKNWLFAGSVEAAHRMAMLYSLTATCKLNGIEPYEYFHNTLPTLADYPVSKIADLIPTNWKPSPKG
jgi:transposase